MKKLKATPKEQINLRLPPDLIDRIRKKLHDPVYNKTGYGSVSTLITELLYQWDAQGDKKLEDI